MNDQLLNGSIYKNLVTLTFPLIIGNIMQQLYNTCDALIIRLFIDANAFAAVGIASSIMNLCIFLLSGFYVGAGVLISQTYGSRDFKKLKKTIFTIFLIGTSFAFFLSIIGLFTLSHILVLIKTPTELFSVTKEYLWVILTGLIVTWAYLFLSGILSSIGKTNMQFVFLSISVILNIILDTLFLAYVQPSLKMAALATILSQFISAILCFMYLKRSYAEIMPTKQTCGLYPQLIRHTLSFGVISALHQSSLQIGKLIVQGTINSLGVTSILAFVSTTKLEGYINSFGASGSQAICILTSQNYGAGKTERVKKIFYKSLIFLQLLALPLSILIFFFAKSAMIIFLGKDQPEALSYSTHYLQIIACVYWIDFLCNTFAGYFRGIGKITRPFLCTSSQIILRVLLSLYFVPKFGLTALAIATGIGWSVMLILDIAFYIYDRITSI